MSLLQPLKRAKHKTVKYVEGLIDSSYFHYYRHTRSLPVEQVSSVVLFLCPYRNLTTLTAATVALHPQVQVLNHAEERLLSRGSLRFALTHRQQDLDLFITDALAMSLTGMRGIHGGSIRHSHAMDHAAMAEAYAQDEASDGLPSDLRCLVWKGGGQMQNYLRQHGTDAVAVAEAFPQVRFLSPIRNPFDHIRSLRKFYRKGIPPYLQDLLSDLSSASLYRYVLGSHHAIFQAHRQHPEQFLYFLERDMGAALLTRMATLMGVEALPTWVDSAATVFTINKQYTHERAEQETFAEVLHTAFATDPTFVAFISDAFLA